jgi:hypothetical protein
MCFGSLQIIAKEQSITTDSSNQLLYLINLYSSWRLFLPIEKFIIANFWYLKVGTELEKVGECSLGDTGRQFHSRYIDDLYLVT